MTSTPRSSPAAFGYDTNTLDRLLDELVSTWLPPSFGCDADAANRLLDEHEDASVMSTPGADGAAFDYDTNSLDRLLDELVSTWLPPSFGCDADAANRLLDEHEDASVMSTPGAGGAAFGYETDTLDRLPDDLTAAWESELAPRFARLDRNADDGRRLLYDRVDNTDPPTSTAP